MFIKPISFKVNEDIIDGAILSKDGQDAPPNFIFLHGGAGNKERIYDVIPPLVNDGTNVLAMDFSGHGKSTGDLKKSSLKKRCEEARKAIEDFAATDKLIVCGASMGGYIAIKMLEYFQVETLILFCPALYDKKAYNLRFDDGFTEAIRIPESWRNTDALDLLKTFTGNLLIIMGDQDEIIPGEVIPLIMEHAFKADRRELYTLPGCHHKIFSWIKEHDDDLLKLQAKLQDYVL